MRVCLHNADENTARFFSDEIGKHAVIVPGISDHYDAKGFGIFPSTWNRIHSQQVVARNVSSGGALLVGLEMELQSGDLVLLQYGAQRARYRIVWTRDSEGPRRILAAVQRLEEDYCPWQDLLTPPVRPG